MQITITIKGSKLFEPIILDDVEWETARKGEPGKLTFTVVKDEIISFPEGSEVTFRVDGKILFFGYVFQKSRNKDQHIKITVYDQLRYFKNKDLYIYQNKTASELIKMLAKDFGLRTGSIEDTGYKIEKRVEDGVTLFDIVQNALDITLSGTNNLYVLYDDAGKLTLKNIKNLKKNGVVVFLDRSLENLIVTGDRPLSSNIETLKKRYNERYEIYKASADIIINANGSIEENVTAVKEGFLNEDFSA